MKRKYFVFILLIFLIVSLQIPIVKAENDSIIFDDSYTIYDAFDDYENKTLDLGESTITQDDINVGINSLNNLNKARVGGYEWVLKTMTTHKSNGVLKGHYFKKVAAGVTVSKSVDASFTINGTIKGVPLAAGATFTTSISYNGPSGTEAVGSNKATHRLYSTIAYGKIMKYTYEYKDRYTGHVSSTKTEYYITNKSTQKYSNLTYIKASNKSLLVRSAGTAKTKSFSSETDFKNKVNSESPVSYIDF